MWTGKIPFIFNPFLDHLSLFDSFSLLRESVDSPADFVLLEYFYTALIRSTITPVFDGLRGLIFEKKLLVSLRLSSPFWPAQYF